MKNDVSLASHQWIISQCRHVKKGYRDQPQRTAAAPGGIYRVCGRQSLKTQMRADGEDHTGSIKTSEPGGQSETRNDPKK